MVILVGGICCHIASQRHSTVLWLSNDPVSERVAISVGSCQSDCLDSIFRSGNGLILRDRWGVDSSLHQNADGGDIAVVFSIVGLVGECVNAAEGRVWYVGEGTIGVEGQGAVGWIANLDRGQRIVISICVIAQHARYRYGQSNPKGGSVGIVYRNRRIIGGSSHYNANGGDIAVKFSVVRFVGEAVSTTESSGRSVSEGTVCVQGHGAVSRARDQSSGQRTVFDITIVRQNTRCSHCQRGFVRRTVSIVNSHRGVIDRGDSDRHGSDVAVKRAIVDLVGKAVGAVPVGIGCVGGNIADDRESAVGGLVNNRVGQSVAINICTKQGDVNRCIFRSSSIDVLCDRGNIDGGHGDRDGGDIAIHRAIVDFVGEAIGTVKVGIGSIGNNIADDRNGAVSGLADDLVGQSVTVNISADQCDVNRGIFRRSNVNIFRDRGIIDRSNRDRDGCFIGPTFSRHTWVADQVVDEGISAEPILVRCVDEGSVAIQNQAAVTDIGFDSHSEVIAIHVIVVG